MSAECKTIDEKVKHLKKGFKRYRGDKEVVLAAVKEFGYNFRHASDTLKNDRPFVLEVLEQEGTPSCSGLKFASEDLKSDKQFILEAVKRNGFSLEWASDDLRNDKEVVLEAVRQYGFAYQHASAGIQEICRDDNPVSSLERAIQIERITTSHEKLQSSLAQKAAPPKQVRGLKI